MPIKTKKPWSRMTKAEKRATTIKDALLQVKLGRAKIKAGRYFKVMTDYRTYDEKDEQFNKHLDKVKCEVCLKGGLMLGHIDRHNNCVVKNQWLDVNDDNDYIKERLGKLFPVKELDMMETAFEWAVKEDDTKSLCIDGDLDDPTPLGEICIAFGKKFREPQERMEAILLNTLKYGEFSPEKGLQAIERREKRLAKSNLVKS
jgi:hypothetical protein